ncbi:hypothetical protein NLO72_25040, partial [Pseudomonas tremae]|uniref:hypothetical protein n=1 Tax=Pseudomonas tremae TaxID=200454 RepID=UPI00210E97D2
MTAVIHAAEPASLRARIIHFFASLLLARILIRALTTAGYEATSRRIVRVGINVNRLASLQRRRVPRGVRLAPETWNGLPVEWVSPSDLDAPITDG